MSLLTDDEKCLWNECRLKLFWFGLVCNIGEVLSVGSIVYLGLNMVLPVTLLGLLTGLACLYLIALPLLVTNMSHNTLRDSINLTFMGLGIYLFYLLLQSGGGSWAMLIVYIWCMLGAGFYDKFRYNYTRYTRLDELFSIEVMATQIVEINRHIFNLNAEKDADKIAYLKEFKQYMTDKRQYLMDKHNIK